MADVATQILITAKDEASAAINKVGTGFDALSGKVVAFAAAAGVAAAAVGAGRWLTDLTSKSIEAAGRIADLSQSTGVAGETLTRYSLAAKLGGVEIDGLAGGLQKLNVKIDDAANGGAQASAAFNRIGVSVKDASGEVRSTEAILGDVADRFAGMEDGAAKTAIAVDLFGKSGAALIPMLNDGRDGLADAAAAADALGLTLSNDTIAAADAVGDSLDVMGQISVGLGNKIMTQVAPTILGLTQRFTDFVVESGAVDFAAKAIAGAFNVMVNAGQIVAGVFQLIGNNVSTVAKAVTLAAQGEFSQAFETLKTGVKNAGTIITTTGKDIAKVWTGELGKVEPKVQATDRAITKLATTTKAAKVETDKAAESYKKFAQSIDEKLALAIAEEASTTKLTEADKLRIKFLGDVENGTIKVTQAERESTLAKLDQLAAIEKQRVAEDAAKKSREEAQKALVARTDAEIKSATAIDEATQKQRAQNEEIGLTKGELAALEIKRLSDVQATLKQKLAVVELTSVSASEIEAIRWQIEGYEELIKLKKEGLAAQAMADAAEAAKDAAKESAEEWKKTSETIESSLTDALMRGFESGKGFLTNLIDTAKNLFNSLVLRPIIQAVVQPIAGAAPGMFGLSGSANAGSGGALGTAENVASLFGLGGLGGSIMAGAGWVTGATTFTGALSAAGSLIGSGSFAGAGAGIGMGLGALAPIALGAWALYKLFGDDGGGPKSGGSISNTGERLFSPSDADAQLAQLGIDQQITALATALGGSFSGQFGIGFDTDPEGDAGSRIASFVRDANGKVLLDNIAGRDVGRSDEAVQSGLSTETARILLAALQGSTLPADIAAYLAQYNAANLDVTAIGKILDTALEMVPKSEQSLVDQALKDPGTYTAVSTEVRELVVLATDQLQVERDQLAALNAAMTQAAAMHQASIAEWIKIAANTLEMTRLATLAAVAPQATPA